MGTYIKTQYTLDENLKMMDGNAITADAAWLVSGSAAIIDVGDAYLKAGVLVDVSAIDIASTDETYFLSIQGSSSATFASTIVELGCLRIGDASTIGAAIDVDSSTGRYVVHFSNYLDGTIYRYIRGYTDFTGTTPSLTAVAYMVKDI